MTNKEFQNILAQYPDDYEIQMDKTFGWEIPSNKNLCEPHLYINTDFGFIEIEPDEYRYPWIDPNKQLPNDNDECVVSVNDEVSSYREMAIYDAATKKFHYYDHYNDCTAAYTLNEIEAWMLIPKNE